MQKKWWKEGIIYQIYPRSFSDSNGDGIGDLQGIVNQLDYLYSLGVDIIWLSPIYKSPNEDNGYDISDYYDIMTEFGNMAVFHELLEGLHQRNMRLLMDLVVNHTSDEHEWFQASRKSKANPYRDYYIWKPPVNGEPPNNWQSFFGGSTWTWDETTKEYYLHLFTPKQPDLNWENPELRKEVYELMCFWLDKGVDGFRMDVFSLFSKKQSFHDSDMTDFPKVIREIYANGPRIHEFLQEMHREVFSKYDVLSVGEGVGVPNDKALEYVSEERNEINMFFHFDHMFIDHGPGGRLDPRKWTWTEFFEIFFEWDQTLGEKGWGSIYLGNHDFPRMVSRFGNDGKYWKPSAKLLATLLLTLRGTPTIYQGDEIGMTNAPFHTIDEYRDIEMLNSYHIAQEEGNECQILLQHARTQARDHARTPMQWDDTSYAGFSEVQPWILVNPNFHQINVADQETDTDSILNFYRKVITYRKSNEALIYGSLVKVKNAEGMVIYDRIWKNDHLRIILNVSKKKMPISPDTDDVLELTNYHFDEIIAEEMQPWEARVYRKK